MTANRLENKVSRRNWLSLITRMGIAAAEPLRAGKIPQQVASIQGNALAVCPRGERICVHGPNSSVLLYDVKTRRKLFACPVPNIVQASFFPQGDRLLLTSILGGGLEVRIVEKDSTKCDLSAAGKADIGTSVYGLAGGNTLHITRNVDFKELRVVDPDGMVRFSQPYNPRELPEPALRAVLARVAFRPDRGRFIHAVGLKTIVCRNAEDLSIVWTRTFPEWVVQQIVFDESGGKVAVALSETSWDLADRPSGILVVDAMDGRLQSELIPHDGRHGLAFSPKGDSIALCQRAERGFREKNVRLSLKIIRLKDAQAEVELEHARMWVTGSRLASYFSPVGVAFMDGGGILMTSGGLRTKLWRLERMAAA